MQVWPCDAPPAPRPCSGSDVVTAPEGTSLEAATTALRKHRATHLPVISKAGALVGVVSRRQITEGRSFPAPGPPSVDAQGRLLVGAAVGTREQDKERVAALVAAGVDVVILDSSQVHPVERGWFRGCAGC
jgi:IMP dehydrogenase